MTYSGVTLELLRSEPNPKWSGLMICLKFWSETGMKPEKLSKSGGAPNPSWRTTDRCILNKMISEFNLSLSPYDISTPQKKASRD